MICLRCGYCCYAYDVIIIKLGIEKPTFRKEEEFQHKKSDEFCPHLSFNGIEASCDIHDKKWFKKTPCHSHSQIGKIDDDCRIGRYILDNFKDLKAYIKRKGQVNDSKQISGT